MLFLGTIPDLNQTVFPVSESTSDLDRCARWVKGKLWTKSGPAYADIVQSLNEKTALVFLLYIQDGHVTADVTVRLP